jgi:hypothetical protein
VSGAGLSEEYYTNITFATDIRNSRGLNILVGIARTAANPGSVYPYFYLWIA